MALKPADSVNELLHVGFNQDHGCFACGTEKGFCIFNCDPLKERFRRDFDAGIGIVEMLFRCNILALVGGGKNPKYPPNKVMIWDDYQNKCIAELEFRSPVRAVKLRRDRIVVVLDTKVYVYNFVDLALIHQVETYANPRGLCALSPSSNTVLAVPGTKPGTVHVELYDLKTTQTIAAHNNSLTQVVLNLEGTRLATASEKGTLIRIFNPKNGDQLRELRRGADKAEIYSLSFNQASTWLCVSSDKGTVHIYGLAAIDENNPMTTHTDEWKVKQSSFSFMKEILPGYFSSEWSFAQFHLPETAGHSIVAFGNEKNCVIAVCYDGSYFKYSFDPQKGGECKLEASAKFK
eukprot:TRINITY_DN18327_c0_g1_i1.p1 TRINITY_DN18327_c0_g1~~TRINITY_DN18327_c0_g1_i1.p1  ORF type:complete len:348 (-),score=96.68 TRINITY_DN18327_c0_g1_i1:237-1280(-)